MEDFLQSLINESLPDFFWQNAGFSIFLTQLSQPTFDGILELLYAQLYIYLNYFLWIFTPMISRFFVVID